MISVIQIIFMDAIFYFGKTDGEERAGDGSYNPDEILDTENKVEFSGSNTSPSTSVTASTSPSSTINNPSTVTSISLVKTSEPSAASSSQSESKNPTDFMLLENGPS